MEQQEYVVLREGFVLRQLRQPGEVVLMHARQAQHMRNVMLRSQWDKLDATAKQRLADPHGDGGVVMPYAADEEDAA